NFFFIAESVDDNWYRNYVLNRDKAVRLAIEVDGKYIGNVNLTGIHPVNRSAEFSIMIGEKNYWGQGIGREASQQMLRHGFDDLQLHRIWLGVLAGNIAAQRLYESLGFRIEGAQRQAIFKQGGYHDLILMGLL